MVSTLFEHSHARYVYDRNGVNTLFEHNYAEKVYVYHGEMG